MDAGATSCDGAQMPAAEMPAAAAAQAEGTAAAIAAPQASAERPEPSSSAQANASSSRSSSDMDLSAGAGVSPLTLPAPRTTSLDQPLSPRHPIHRQPLPEPASPKAPQDTAQAQAQAVQALQAPLQAATAAPQAQLSQPSVQATDPPGDLAATSVPSVTTAMQCDHEMLASSSSQQPAQQPAPPAPGTSPLLSLPSELLEVIWDKLFTEADADIANYESDEEGGDEEGRSRVPEDERAYQRALRGTCRSLRDATSRFISALDMTVRPARSGRTAASFDALVQIGEAELRRFPKASTLTHLSLRYRRWRTSDSMHATYYEALDTTALPQGVLPAIFLSMEQRLADLLELKISSEAAIGFGDMATVAEVCPRLSLLSLWSNTPLAGPLFRPLRTLAHLHKLHLSMVTSPQSRDLVLSSLSHLTQLSELEIWGPTTRATNDPDAWQMQHVLPHMQPLARLTALTLDLRPAAREPHGLLQHLGAPANPTLLDRTVDCTLPAAPRLCCGANLSQLHLPKTVLCAEGLAALNAERLPKLTNVMLARISPCPGAAVASSGLAPLARDVLQVPQGQYAWRQLTLLQGCSLQEARWLLPLLEGLDSLVLPQGVEWTLYGSDDMAETCSAVRGVLTKLLPVWDWGQMDADQPCANCCGCCTIASLLLDYVPLAPPAAAGAAVGAAAGAGAGAGGAEEGEEEAAAAQPTAAAMDMSAAEQLLSAALMPLQEAKLRLCLGKGWPLGDALLEVLERVLPGLQQLQVRHQDEGFKQLMPALARRMPGLLALQLDGREDGAKREPFDPFVREAVLALCMARACLAPTRTFAVAHQGVLDEEGELVDRVLAAYVNDGRVRVVFGL